ncbi:BLUF domain-containing protein [Roseibacterium beibuensis]|uniref:BLUF domain-containing protein n=1 Tax=[Roseibacterium] beibuensis TaxID=1193142 RepID=UPI00217F081C|nr:BLUF domain-containing protein [Roseibacterium beibuensis]MCS6624954.1 BLUF domain-containing protein [Roseibacterium beibuensis]
MFGRSRPEALERLVYCSRARIDTASLQAISELLGVSQRNNVRDGLTGALAVNDGWFLQVIEGPTSALDRLLRRLAEDARHTEIEILSRRPVSGRLFPDWSMVAARITPDIGPHLKRLIDECRVAPEAAVDALLRIVAGRKAPVEAEGR